MKNFSYDFILYFWFSYIISTLFCFIVDIYAEIKNKNIHHTERNNVILHYKHAIPVVSFNLFILGPPIFHIYYIFIPEINNLNTIYYVIYIFFYGLSVDISFYITHRIMHIPFFMNWSHKLHHSIRKPFGIHAIYTHWFDFIFANTIPVAFGPLIFGSTDSLLKLWIVLSVTSTIIQGHGGWKIFDDFHDIHHRYVNCNYGQGGWFMDRIFNTIKQSNN